MALLHESAIRSRIEARIAALAPDTRPVWGKMSVDQMLWHVNEALASALGEVTVPAERPPLPPKLMKFLVINLPWPKGAPTMPAFVAQRQHDFEAERARCYRLLKQCAARPLDAEWPTHPMFGAISGREVSRLHAKHLNHHLRQFGV